MPIPVSVLFAYVAMVEAEPGLNVAVEIVDAQDQVVPGSEKSMSSGDAKFGVLNSMDAVLGMGPIEFVREGRYYLRLHVNGELLMERRFAVVLKQGGMGDAQGEDANLQDMQ